MADFKDFSELGSDQTFAPKKESVAPEEEFFHSCYIPGKVRENHIGVKEIPGSLQIRGVEYNQDEVYFIITHTKQILSKDDEQKNVCFSYQDGPPPWQGTNHGPCGRNKAERSTDSFCVSCKAQLIVAGIMTDAQGNPRKDANGKPLFMFLRGKGMKYSNVSEHIGKFTQLEMSPLFTPESDESKHFEKTVTNKMRYVTKVTRGTAPSKYGEKDVFVLEPVLQIPNEAALEILNIAKKTKEKFDDKMNWTKRSKAKSSGYADADTGFPEVPKVTKESSPQEDSSQPPAVEGGSFSDIDFDFN